MLLAVQVYLVEFVHGFSLFMVLGLFKGLGYVGCVRVENASGFSRVGL